MRAAAFGVGLLTGAFGGLVGVGGGVIMVPLLTGWTKLTQHEAHATSLAGVVATGIFGAFTYARGGAVDWRAAIILAAVAVVATFAAARHSRNVPAARLRRYFGIFMIVAAVLLIAKDELLLLRAPAGSWTIVVLLLSGVVVGVSAGLLGVGGGAIMVPLLVIAAGLEQHIAQGTSLAAIVPGGLSGTLAHAGQGTVRKDVLLTLLPGIALGSWLGGRFALTLPGGTLRVVFAVVLIGLGARYLWRKPAATRPA